MKIKNKAALIAAALLALLVIGWATHAESITYTGLKVQASTGEQMATSSAQKVPQVDARQAVWIDALEWCESNGVVTAINPKDSDNTPSYGAFQFKPDTYAAYAKKIGLASTTDYMNPVGQRLIVEAMVLSTTTQWLHQFPDCVANHVGFPPK